MEKIVTRHNYLCDKCGDPIPKRAVAIEDAFLRKYHPACAPSEDDYIWNLLANFATAYNVSIADMHRVSSRACDMSSECPCAEAEYERLRADGWGKTEEATDGFIGATTKEVKAEAEYERLRADGRIRP